MSQHRRAAGECPGHVTRDERRDERRKDPFKTSSTITGIAYRGPKLLQTFVAPMLPLPTARMSSPRVQRTTQYPDGMLPAR